MKINLLLILLMHMSSPDTGKITIEVKGIENPKGAVLVYLYREENGFPASPDKAWKKAAIPLAGTTCIFSFADIPYGTYAVSIVHDENNNGLLDTTFLGIPKEGVGTSNNAKGNFGPPKYSDATFAHRATETKLEIRTSY